MSKLNFFKFIFLALLIGTFTDMKAQLNTGSSRSMVERKDEAMMVRIAEIEIVPENLEEYLTILKTEAAASVELEPGVLAIFPMYEKENPSQIRILEIYASKAAYQSHLKTPHFLHYKTSTQKMVKSLKLVDMESIDPEGMKQIFRKLK